MSFIDFDAPTNVARYPQRYESADELEPLSKRMRVEGDAERERETVDDIFKSIDDEDGENSAEKDDLATAKQSTFDDDDVDDQPKPKRVMAKIDPERCVKVLLTRRLAHALQTPRSTRLAGADA